MRILTLRRTKSAARRTLPGGIIYGRPVRIVALQFGLLLLQPSLLSAGVDFVWSGAVTPTSVRIKAKITDEGAVVRVAYSNSNELTGLTFSSPDTASLAVNYRVIDASLSDLAPGTTYYYALEQDGMLDTLKRGQFTTFHEFGAGIFTIALGSCAATGSSHAAFQTIRGHNPLMILHMGDFHYQNIAVDDRDVFRAAYDVVLASPNQSALYRSTAIDYVWDDHDYGPNNSDSTAPGRTASRQTYQEYVPHYPLVAGTGDVPIYHSFTIGRVAFIVTDSRSARSPASATDDAAKTMLGADQKAWFKQELLSLEGAYPIKVWVNTLPWIGTTGDDGWHLYTNERRELADFIKDEQITGLCMVSGDAHMLAIDDGTNSDYATDGGAGFPVFHAAALDQSGSVKGGPYSHGAYPGRGQFGLMTVLDSGLASITVQWRGLTSTNTQRVAYTFTVPADPLPCDCTHHGDVAGNDGALNILDVAAIIDHVFRGGAEPIRDLVCPHRHRGDINCDAVSNIVDIVRMIDVAFRGGAIQCTPCDCPPYPAICP
jgi:phosphodiesterase/alkaline phosphatase D-like protein